MFRRKNLIEVDRAAMMEFMQEFGIKGFIDITPVKTAFWRKPVWNACHGTLVDRDTGEIVGHRIWLEVSQKTSEEVNRSLVHELGHAMQASRYVFASEYEDVCRAQAADPDMHTIKGHNKRRSQEEIDAYKETPMEKEAQEFEQHADEWKLVKVKGKGNK